MAEWLVEQGIAEERAILVEGDAIIAARLHWPGSLCAGQVEDAVLIVRSAGSRRGTARFANGEEALVDHLPPGASEGAPLRLKVTRAAIAEAGRLKRAQARPTDEPVCSAPGLLQQLQADGASARAVHRFAVGGWEDILSDAFSREISFAGGSLHLAPTPAMTLVDIDGDLEPRALALASVPAIAAAIRCLDLAGSIGIDFPSLPEKADRRAVDEALGQALVDWPHERTAMNGFGFVQLVARLVRPSLLHRAMHWPCETSARLLLRRAECVEEPGALLLRAHPCVIAAIRPEWREQLARRTGRIVHYEADPALAVEAGSAQFTSL